MGAAALKSVDLAARKTLANRWIRPHRINRPRKEQGDTRHRRDRKTSTDYTYQIPRLFNPSRDGTFLTGEKNAINFSRSYDAASNS